jgi:hypothetical protein
MRRPAAATIQALHLLETIWIWLVEPKSRTKDREETMNLYGPKQLAESMRTVRKNTIQIAEGHSGKGLQLSSHAGKPVSAGNTGPYCVALPL